MPLVKSIEFKADVDMNKREISGYAATWDLDQVGDVIHKGAFKKTISERLSSIKVMRNHSILIGKPLEMFEDSKGLATVAYISDTPSGEETLKLARDGVLTEQSIQFNIPQSKSNIDDGGIRHIHEVKLFEFGPVDFPANSAAKILSVKSISEQILSGENLTLEEVNDLAIKLAELKALLTEKPPKCTLTSNQPQELKELEEALENFGYFAR